MKMRMALAAKHYLRIFLNIQKTSTITSTKPIRPVHMPASKIPPIISQLERVRVKKRSTRIFSNKAVFFIGVWLDIFLLYANMPIKFLKHPCVESSDLKWLYRLLLTVFCFGICTGFAQVPVGADAQDNINTLAGGSMNSIVRKFDTSYKGVLGSPFLSDIWNTGTVVLTNGKSFHNVLLKIDLYGNEIIARRQSGDSIIILANSIRKVSLTDVQTGRKYHFEKASSITGEQPGLHENYLDVLHQGKYMLLAERRKIRIKATASTHGYSPNKPYDEFVNETVYFIRKPDQPLEKIKLTRKGLLDVFPDHQQEIKSFISQKQLNPKDEAHAIQIFAYSESLLK